MFPLHDVHQLLDLQVDKLRVLVRADLDCPTQRDGEVLDDSKLRALVPTLQWLLEREAMVVVAGHLGPLDGGAQRGLSLADVGVRLATMLETELYLPDENLGPVTRKLLREQRPGHIVLLENLAFDAGEGQRSEDYARELIAPFEVCVIDGLFGKLDTASLSLAPKLCQQRAMGPHLMGELSRLNRFLEAPSGRAVWCVGGRLGERLTILERALTQRPHFVLGTELALPLLAASGRDVPLDDERRAEVSQARTWLSRAKDMGAKVHLPTDFLVQSGSETLARNVADLRPSETVLDLGPKSAEQAAKVAAEAPASLLLEPLGAAVRGRPAHPDATRTLLESVGAAASPEGMLILGSQELSALLETLPEIPRRRLSNISTSKAGVLDLLAGAKSPSLEALRIPL